MKLPYATVLIALAFPVMAPAASLNPLDGGGSLGAPLDLLQSDPAPSLTTAPKQPETAREFVGGDVLEANPLRGMLIDDQWAAPKANYAGPLLRRR